METQDKADEVVSKVGGGAPTIPDLAHDTITTTSTRDVTPAGIRSSPPLLADKLPSLPAPQPAEKEETHAAKSDSEAETIVLPGKDGYSPSKVRKTIKHEDNSDDDSLRKAADVKTRDNAGASRQEGAKSALGKRKRSKTGSSKDDHPGQSSGLSSVPTSPVRSAHPPRSRPAESNLGASRSSSPVERKGHKGRKTRSESREDGELDSSEDESEANYSRYRGTSLGQNKQPRGNHETKGPKSEGAFRNPSRSQSPLLKGHRRATSTQNSSRTTNGSAQKKKRVPAPLLSTRERPSSDYHSDDSSVSGSAHPRSSRIRKLATPATAESANFGTKMPHKKHRDGIGRTPLARACASGNLEDAKRRLEHDPEDIDVADNAGNTPLQIASLEGCEEIVKLLIEKNCDIQCENYDKETPLLDAVDNGHLEVVKLLLDAGANPNRGSLNGEEPLDRVPDDADNAEEIRKALREAKSKFSKIRRPSEEARFHEHDDGRSSHGFNSPRNTPPVRAPAATTGRRAPNSRFNKTSDQNLWMSMDPNTLREAAAQGDIERVVTILNVKEGLINDPASTVAAAKGGHVDVLNVLLAVGGADPDPEPVKFLQWERSTPMLASIGREKSIPVIELLLSQANFNPTRRHDGLTYWEIARKRTGPMWKEEEKILKDANDKFLKTNPPELHSPDRRRDDSKRTSRKHRDTSPNTRPSKRKLSASEPRPKDLDSRKRISSVSNSRHDDRVRTSSKPSDSQGSLKKMSGKPRKDERGPSNALSDRESTPLGPPKQRLSSKKTDTDANASSDNETVKPRRKLVSGRDLKGDKDKRRRSSVTSGPSSVVGKEKGSAVEDGKSSIPASKTTAPRLIGSTSEPETPSDRAVDRSRSTKREESKDRLTAIRGDSPIKRARSSTTPPRSESRDPHHRKFEENGVPPKRRRVDQETVGRKSEHVRSPSPSNATRPSAGPDSIESTMKQSSQTVRSISGSKNSADVASSPGQKTVKHAPVNQQDLRVEPEAVPIKSERLDPVDKEAIPAARSGLGVPAEDQIMKDREEATRELQIEAEAQAQAEARAKAKAEEEVKAAAEAKAKAKAEAEVKAAAEAKAIAKAEAEAAEAASLAAKEKREAEEALEMQRIEEAKQAREAREEAVRQEELKRQREEAERKERQKREDAEAKERAEAENKRIYNEQVRHRQQEEARKRSLREAELRAERERIAQQQEIARLSKLPSLLRWFDGFSDAKTRDFASRFRTMTGVRYSTIQPGGTEGGGREQWVLNTQVALLLGIKDLQLSQYTAWRRLPASPNAKLAIWKLEGDRYAMTDPKLRDYRNEGQIYNQRVADLRNEAKPLFMELDLFFVKVS
jgi:hypothetical protein